MSERIKIGSVSFEKRKKEIEKRKDLTKKQKEKRLKALSENFSVFDSEKKIKEENIYFTLVLNKETKKKEIQYFQKGKKGEKTSKKISDKKIEKTFGITSKERVLIEKHFPRMTEKDITLSEFKLWSTELKSGREIDGSVYLTEVENYFVSPFYVNENLYSVKEGFAVLASYKEKIENMVGLSAFFAMFKYFSKRIETEKGFDIETVISIEQDLFLTSENIENGSFLDEFGNHFQFDTGGTTVKRKKK